MRRNEPVLRKLAALVSGPIDPASQATPVKALSNLLVSSIWLTPSFFISASSASICASVQVGRPSWTLQPSGTEVSMPITTASLPALMALRASKGLVTMRYQPRPGPPCCSSM